MHCNHHRRSHTCRPLRRKGPGFGRRIMMRGCLADDPERADRMLRCGVAWMRDEGYSDAEIRGYLDDLHECGHLEDADIDSFFQ